MNDSYSIVEVKEKPKICAIDLDREIVEAIKNKGLHCFDGTLGSQVKVPNLGQYDQHPCLLNYNFPVNLHEYDIVMVDLRPREAIKYIESDHTYSHVKGDGQKLLLSSYPETLFDPRPLSAKILWNKLNDLLNKNTLVIVFSSFNEIVGYQPVQITSRGYVQDYSFVHSLYDFLPFIQGINNKNGNNTKITVDLPNDIANILHKYNDKFFYQTTFSSPTKRVQDAQNRYSTKLVIRNENFIPLIWNSLEEIVGFIDFLYEPTAVWFFPQLVDKKNFIIELLDSTLPSIFPQIFPFSNRFAWLKSPTYFLPNQFSLLEKKKKIEEEYKLALTDIEDKIKQNQLSYQFLHNLITETGDRLVKSVEEFFSWLGFENIINMDETKPEVKEEDLQISLDSGLLVVEVKGIGGTSKDSECSQISKIKYRRARERNKFDVHALYIVNHQRYLPPHERKNPPFSKHQITDAESDERGLLTTYELFNLYSNIEKGFISKQDARFLLLKYGSVKFKLSNSTFLGIPSEIHHNGQVIILFIENIKVCRSTSIIACNQNTWFRVEILEIQLDGKSVDNVSNGEIGIKLSKGISKNSELWLIYT